MPAASALSLSPCMASAVMAIIGGLLMSGRRLTSDSGEPDLWSNGSVFMGPREPISIDPSPHIPLQQTTVTAVVFVSGLPSEFARLRVPCADVASCAWVPRLTAQNARELGELVHNQATSCGMDRCS